ncbi:hypothetical protein [Nocardia sp. XZ_19_385]|uniref:hypothetical protein n=1 Tax=Nocardia sp. XZ_19_385 TaxID=2769488 RepID=UPI00188FC84C|nr:hypothetical protein [Nocardia sp. XZ_19_385]
MRAAGLPDQLVADAPLMLFGFLKGYLLAVLSAAPGKTGDTPEIDPTRYPTMAGLTQRMLDAVLTGIRGQAEQVGTARA